MKRKTYNIFPVSLMVYSIIAMIAGYFFWEITHDSPENYSEFWRGFFAINTLLSLFVGPLGYLLYHKHRNTVIVVKNGPPVQINILIPM